MHASFFFFVRMHASFFFFCLLYEAPRRASSRMTVSLAASIPARVLHCIHIPHTSSCACWHCIPHTTSRVCLIIIRVCSHCIQFGLKRHSCRCGCKLGSNSEPPWQLWRTHLHSGAGHTEWTGATMLVEGKARATWQQQRCGYNRLPFT